MRRHSRAGTKLLVLAKTPMPGRVKTRLAPVYGPCGAASLAEAALVDTLAATMAAVELAADCGFDVEPLLVLDGPGGDWLPAGLATLRQRGNDLDERLAGAFADSGPGPVALIGMDTPQVTPGQLVQAIADLAEHDAVFGPAADGGWWLLGLRRPDPALLLGVATSRRDTGFRQRQRLVDAGLDVALQPELRDVDTPPDAEAAATLAPTTHFARLLAALNRAVG